MIPARYDRMRDQVGKPRASGDDPRGDVDLTGTDQ